MPHATDIRLTHIVCESERYEYRTPMKFGGRVVTDAVLLNVTVEVETRDGRRGTGFGSMPMSNAWGWPSQVVDGATTLVAMIEFGQQAVAAARQLTSVGHPLELTHELSHGHAAIADGIRAAMSLRLHVGAAPAVMILLLPSA